MPNGLDDEIMAVLEKRILDAAFTCPGLKIQYNGKWLPKVTFADLPALCIPKEWAAADPKKKATVIKRKRRVAKKQDGDDEGT